MNLFGSLRRKRQADRVSITPEVVTRFRPDGVQETVRWADLAEVGIITTDEGPWSEDVFWLLVGCDGKSGCAVPQCAEGSKELLEVLQKLPGFDNEAVIEAMGSTSNAKFTCWKRKTQRDAPPNGGPAEHSDNSAATGGLPSVC
jgi:hypothetical protein